MPLDQGLIRTRVLMIAEAGPLAETVIRDIIKEAERHAQERAEKANLGQGLASLGLEVSTDLPPTEVLARIRGIREEVQGAYEAIRGSPGASPGLPGGPPRAIIRPDKGDKE